MKSYLIPDPWKIIEDGFHEEYQRISESIFSLGNGRFGQRGNFEEHYSGDTLKGNYFGGIYYPDKTKVGWWKNGYPEYFAKVLNAVEWAGIGIAIGDHALDLHVQSPQKFRRVLDMQHGLLSRSITVEVSGHVFTVQFERFCSMARPDIGAVRCVLSSDTYDGLLHLNCDVNWNVLNEDANWDDQFWIHKASVADIGYASAMAETKKTGFVVGSSAVWSIDGAELTNVDVVDEEFKASNRLSFRLTPGEPVTFDKIVAHHSTMHHDTTTLMAGSLAAAREAARTGYEGLRAEHQENWLERWQNADIVIDGDVHAQQAIRFNIFQLFQTYTGDDARLNIGPKGFTGEKYGGSTYWDTEAYCVPFFLASAPASVARQLLHYRYRHLPKAIENAGKLGFENGAALYPMVTMNGEECHNEWEITFEEIHRNGAIVYAIHDYIRYTGDQSYLLDGGLEVCIAVARFWAQRTNWSNPRSQYVILGVTGPNEYENNVDNNWYTNYIAAWCLRFASASIDTAGTVDASQTKGLLEKVDFREEEREQWLEIAEQMFLPEDPVNKIFLQQANYLEKTQLTVDDIPEAQRPIHEHWSWDRILRSCFIKQADVLQGLFFFEEHFDQETIRRNFRFYEPRTVHESSLSPCVHSILASILGLKSKAYEMYLRTSRLDLDDINNDTDDGLHITSMAGTWMSIVKGFGGARVLEDRLQLRPSLPDQWQGLAFQMRFRENVIKCEIRASEIKLINLSGPAIELHIHERQIALAANEQLVVPIVVGSP